MSGKRNPSPTVLKKLHGSALSAVKGRTARDARGGEGAGLAERASTVGWSFARTTAQTTRIGGRLPHGANFEFAYRTGYDGIGHTYVHHVIQRGVLRPAGEAGRSCGVAKSQLCLRASIRRRANRNDARGPLANSGPRASAIFSRLIHC